MARRTLRDRLSHLTPQQVDRRLGPGSQALLREGALLEVEPTFRWRAGRLEFVVDGTRLTLFDDPAARYSLGVRCRDCGTLCAHAAAALRFLLDEKVTLGLAALPEDPDQGARPLSEEELVAAALEARRDRARDEPMRLKSLSGKKLWGDYTVTSRQSARTYRVALRGEGLGESFCSCPDFRKNTLGTCKHILYTLSRVRKKFTAQTFERAPRRRRTALRLVYGAEIELRLAMADRPPSEVRDELAAFIDRPIRNVRALVQSLRRLEDSGHGITVYPDAEEWMQAKLIEARLTRISNAVRSAPADHPLRSTLLRTELLPYQLDGIAFAVGARRAILADDMGLGKTIQGIGVAELLAREVGIERVLVVCPASVKGQWASEIERFSGRETVIVAGGVKRRWKQYGKAFFTICNYEQILRDREVVDTAGFDLVILDEAQRIKNWEAKTSVAIKAIRSQFALALTGTPLENRIDELFSVVEFIDDRRLAPAFRFYNRHRVVDDNGKAIGARHLAELREQLAPVLLRRTRASVLDELPPRTTEVVRIEPTPEQLELHNSHHKIAAQIASKKYLTEMDLLRLQKALLMARMAADSAALLGPDEPEASSKLDEIETLLARLLAEPTRKVIVFSEWTRMLDRIEARLAAMGAAPMRLDGSVPQGKRKGLVDQFQTSKDATVILMSNAGATGLNLQAADTIVNVDLPWNPAVLEQRIGRAHRMGQTRPVHVFLMVTTGTIEESMLGTLAAKQELFQAVLDPDSEVDEVRAGGGMEELRKRLEVLLGKKPEDADHAQSEQSALASSSVDVPDSVVQERLSVAAGGLVEAAFGLIAEMLPARDQAEAARTSSASAALGAADQLVRSAGKDAAGRPTLTLTLPSEAALTKIAQTFARLATLAQPADESDTTSQ